MAEYCSGGGEMGECEGEQGEGEKKSLCHQRNELDALRGGAGGGGSPFLASDNQN